MEIDTGTPDDGSRTTDVIGTERTRSGRGRRRGAAIAVGAVVIVGGGAAAALAAGTSPSATPSPGSPSPSTSPSYGSGAPGEGGAGHGRGHGPGGVRGLEGSALHGTITVPSAGGYEQVLVQRGTVTAVSPTSLAVKSADGYTHTYVLNAATRVNGTVGDTSSLAVDDTVRVLAADDSTARLVNEPGSRPKGTPPAGAPEGRLPGEGLRRHGPPAGEATPGATPPAVPGSSRTLPGAATGGTDT